MLYEQVSGGGMAPDVYAPGTNHALLYALRGCTTADRDDRNGPTEATFRAPYDLAGLAGQAVELERLHVAAEERNPSSAATDRPCTRPGTVRPIHSLEKR